MATNEARRTHLLLVDAEPLVLESLGLALGRLGWLRVSTASTSAEAQEIAERDPPELVVLDLRVPAHDGLALIERLRARDPTLAIVATTAYGLQLRREALASGASCFLEKPFRVSDLRGVLQTLLVRHETMAPVNSNGFEGRLESLSLAEVLQATCIARRVGRIEIRTEEGSRGTIWVRDGDVCDARRGETVGEDAFYSLLGEERGDFRVVLEPHELTRTISLGWQELLMEGARRLDEARAERPSAERARSQTPFRFAFDLGTQLPPPPSVPVLPLAAEPANSAREELPRPTRSLPQPPPPDGPRAVDPLSPQDALETAARILAQGGPERAREVLRAASARWPDDRRLRANLVRLERIHTA